MRSKRGEENALKTFKALHTTIFFAHQDFFTRNCARATPYSRILAMPLGVKDGMFHEVNLKLTL